METLFDTGESCPRCEREVEVTQERGTIAICPHCHFTILRHGHTRELVDAAKALGWNAGRPRRKYRRYYPKRQ